MILIRSKEQYQNCSCQQEPKDEAFTVERLSNLAGTQSGLLEPSSDFVGDSPRVRSNEITGADRPSNITGFGKVASIVSGGSEAGVATRSNRGEGNESALLGSNFERPLGVDSLNISKRNLDAVKQVVQHNTAVSDFHVGAPEQKIAAVPQPGSHHRTLQQTTGSKFDNAEREREQQNRTEADGQIFSEAGPKSHTAMTLGGK